MTMFRDDEDKIGDGAFENEREREEYFMGLAIEEAKKALTEGDIPVGCVIVLGNRVVGRGHNRREIDNNPLAHAEIVAIEDAAPCFPSWRLLDTEMYVTLEPCAMCSGALVNARIARVVIGAMDEKRGCCGSVINLVDDPAFNHRVEIVTGVREEECSKMLSDFFKEIRKEEKRFRSEGEE